MFRTENTFPVAIATEPGFFPAIPRPQRAPSQSIPAMPLVGLSRIAGELAETSGRVFRAVDPTSGETLAPDFIAAGEAEMEEACVAAARAAPEFAAPPAKKRAAFLRLLAGNLFANEATLVDRAVRETALEAGRLRGEIERTVRQLLLFAEELDAGAWLDARIETGNPDRKPTPKPDHRSMRIPVGPVVVFGASNFPFAYSVAGCDTAAAFAAGCPVIAKAHPAHPGVSALTGEIVANSVAESGLPAGVFSLLFDDGHAVGAALTRHPLVKAVAFTGSRRGGRALMDLAAARAHPIPVYAEMGSVNPVFLLPGALAARAEEITAGLHTSCTAGVGQFCTQPGIIAVLAGPETDAFLESFAARVKTTAPAPMLSPAIHAAYLAGTGTRSAKPELSVLAAVQRADAGPLAAGPVIFTVDARRFHADPELRDEIFGPTSLVVLCSSPEEMLTLARTLEGSIAAAVHAEPDDGELANKLLGILAEKAGRVVFNGYTTGVEVSRAIVHGGPYPATSDGRTSSVGATAMLRFTRRICFQNYPDAALPPELRDANPLGIPRLTDGLYSSSRVSEDR